MIRLARGGLAAQPCLRAPGGPLTHILAMVNGSGGARPPCSGVQLCPWARLVRATAAWISFQPWWTRLRCCCCRSLRTRTRRRKQPGESCGEMFSTLKQKVVSRQMDYRWGQYFHSSLQVEGGREGGSIFFRLVKAEKCKQLM